jgi:hypothetical protein
MTTGTNNHTPIASGAAADDTTFNAPLAQLDAAIGDAVANLNTTAKTLVGGINEVNSHVAGAVTIKDVTGVYAILPTDQVIRCSGTFAVTLPPATDSGMPYRIKNISTGMIAVTADGSDLIDGQPTYVLSQFDAVTVIDAGMGVWDT